MELSDGTVAYFGYAFLVSEFLSSPDFRIVKGYYDLFHALTEQAAGKPEANKVDTIQKTVKHPPKPAMI